MTALHLTAHRLTVAWVNAHLWRRHWRALAEALEVDGGVWEGAS